MQLILEPRFLFDASVGAAVKPVASAAQHAFGGSDGGVHADAPSHAHDAAGATQATPTTPDASHAAPAFEIPGAVANPAATELLFVDPRVANWQALAAGVKSDVQVVVLDPAKDAIQQVTQTLDGRSGITAINFLAYGTAGEVEIGKTPLDATSLASHASEITGWSDHLAANADILFWSCDVARGASGQALLADLHTLTGAQVAASSDAIGSAAFGGSWTLDTATGPIDAAMPFTGAALDAYHGILDTPVPTVSIRGPAVALPGGTFTETVTLKNGAANAPGGSPFIEVFAPAGTTENASLVAATESGTVLNVTSVTLSNDGKGHVVAVDPMLRDANGNPQIVAAPAGYQAGDHMYVVQLNPVAIAAGASEQVALTFSLSGSSHPTTTGGLEIAVIGGFQDGGSIFRGTNPAEGNLATDTGNGLATNEPSVAYVTAEAEVSYVASNSTDGTTTGLYRLTVTSAPVLSERPLQGLEFSVTLPSNAIYSGGGISIAGVGAVGATAIVAAGGITGGQSLTLDFPAIAAGGATTILVPLTVSGSAAAGTSGIPSDADPTSGPFSATFPVAGDPANAATFAATDWSVANGYTISLPKFDTTLGTLTDAQVTFKGYVESSGSLTASAAISGGKVTVIQYSPGANMYLIEPGATVSSANALLTVNPKISAFSKITQITDGNTVSFGPATSSATATTTITDATVLTGYEGSGNVTFSLLATTSLIANLGGGNLTAKVATSALASATITYDYTVSIPALATFTAHVYTDTNANAVQGGAEPSLGGVTVNLLDGKGVATGQTAITDASGNVSFTSLAPGSYEISVVTPSGSSVSQQTNIATPTILAPGGTANAIEGLYTPATFTAHVYTDTNADSTQGGGEPNLAGVTVNLLDGAGNPTGKAATTDASGNVSFTGLTPGSYEIAVVTPSGSAVSQATNLLTPTTLTSGGTANAIEGLFTPATFTAHIYTDSNANSAQDGGESNLAGVTVNLLDGAGNPTGKTATTDASGNVSFTSLAPGSYEISVVTPSGSNVSQQTNIATPTILAPGGTANAIEGLYTPATFTAHVYTDSNANSTQDGGEINLAGVTVNLLDGAGNPTGKTATTDSNGNVSFTGLPPGSYEIAVVTPSGATISQATNLLTPTTLTSGSTATAIEGLYFPATFTTHIYTDSNANSTQGIGEPNLAGVTVNLLDGAGNSTGKTATTDASGNVSFTGLTPGNYEIVAVTPSGSAVSEQTNIATPTTLVSGGTATAIEGLYRPVAFSAHVYTDTNGDSNQGGAEPNRPGITVQLLDGKGNPTGKTAVTDANGNVSFTGLTPGTYEIAVLTPGGSTVTQATNILTPVTLTSGQSTTATEGLFVPATLNAHVYSDANGNGAQEGSDIDLAGITVRLLDATGHPTGRTAITDSRGNVSFTGLPPGTYQIAVVAPDGSTVTQATNIAAPIVLAAGQTVQAIEGLDSPVAHIPSPLPPRDPSNPTLFITQNPLLIPDPHGNKVTPLGDFIVLDPDAQARQLYIEARDSDGGPIPSWLTFDPTTRSFSGSPPAPLKKPMVMIVIIRDSKGNQTLVDVPLIAGPSGDQSGLFAQLTSDKFRKAIRNGFGPAPQRHTDLAPDRLPDVIQFAGDTPIDPAARRFDGTLEGRTAFTTQLQAAGRMGRLAQARALLDAWTRNDASADIGGPNDAI